MRFTLLLSICVVLLFNCGRRTTIVDSNENPAIWKPFDQTISPETSQEPLPTSTPDQTEPPGTNESDSTGIEDAIENDNESDTDESKIPQVSPRWTEFFSEEGTASASCSNTEVLVGMGCRGAFCDEIQLHCLPLSENLTIISTQESPSFSEEQGGVTADNQYIDTVRCSGRYCDNLQITWKTFSEENPKKGDSCYETAIFTDSANVTESQMSCLYTEGFTVSGISCSGRFCDNKSLRCCK